MGIKKKIQEAPNCVYTHGRVWPIILSILTWLSVWTWTLFDSSSRAGQEACMCRSHPLLGNAFTCMPRRFYLTVSTSVEQHTAEILTLQDPRVSWTESADTQDGGFWSGIKSRVKIRTPLDTKQSLNVSLLFFDQDPNFNCLSTVPFIKYIIHNVWSEETSSGACSLCLKASFPWVTGCPHLYSCALSEREKNPSKYLPLFICRVDAQSQRLLLIVWDCFFQKNAVSFRNT